MLDECDRWGQHFSPRNLRIDGWPEIDISDITITRLSLGIFPYIYRLWPLACVWNLVWQLQACPFLSISGVSENQILTPDADKKSPLPRKKTKQTCKSVSIKIICLHNDCISMNIGAFCPTFLNESMERNPWIPWSLEVYWSTWSSKRCTADIYQNTKEKTGRYLRNWRFSKLRLDSNFIKGLKRKNDKATLDENLWPMNSFT